MTKNLNSDKSSENMFALFNQAQEALDKQTLEEQDKFTTVESRRRGGFTGPNHKTKANVTVRPRPDKLKKSTTVKVVAPKVKQVVNKTEPKPVKKKPFVCLFCSTQIPLGTYHNSQECLQNKIKLVVETTLINVLKPVIQELKDTLEEVLKNENKHKETLRLYKLDHAKDIQNIKSIYEDLFDGQNDEIQDTIRLALIKKKPAVKKPVVKKVE